MTILTLLLLGPGPGGVHSTAGTTISISAGSPSIFNGGGYAALAWTLIGEVTNLGDFGREYALATHNPASARATGKKKGSFNDGAMALQMAVDELNAGQALLRAGHDDDADYSFRIVTQDGTVYYFRAQVMGYRVAMAGPDNIISATTTLEITAGGQATGIVTVLAA